ncbi:MAG: MerR family transcriptional regulator [Lachnospiraceae bacterium]|nr:MerR family transcriptional regulator [Lachnospiraceae bacterium]
MGLSIGDVEKITGISKDRLRYYEEKRLITPVRDTDNSYREYDNEEVLKLLGIQLYRSMDLGVKEIQQIQDSDTIEEICGVFKRRQKELNFQMTQLQYQQESVSRGIDDCEKIADHLGKYTLKKVRTLRLIDKIDDLVSTETGAKFRTESDGQMIIIRSMVRRIELTPEGIGENAVYVAEETGEEEIECVYTVVSDSAAYDPLMDEYAKCMQWVSKNNIRLDKYCYIRPLLVSHLGKCTETFLEVFAPIIK